jgi:phosphatidylethanolamine-binding protein (PEBP) family uncharacterized protein
MRSGERKKHALRSVGLALGLALVSAGCGTSSQATLSSIPPSSKTGAGHHFHLPNVTVLLTSPGVPTPGGPISARYTCDSAGTSPTLHWSRLPSGTKEIVLFVTSYAYVKGNPVVDWAVAGLDPKLRALDAGKLPRGAVVGRNHLGHTAYSLCPPSGKSETYAAMVLALPRKLAAKTGFDPVTFHYTAEHLASVEGLLTFTYKRG